MAAEAGDLAKSLSVDVGSQGVAASTTITKGEVITFDAGGDVVTAIATSSREDGFGVALETKDNSAGADGDLTVRYARGGTYVYCTASGAIQPGGAVKPAAGGEIAALTVETEMEDLLLGYYIGHEGEEDDATVSADTEVVIVRLAD
jgi:hypothetical protein